MSSQILNIDCFVDYVCCKYLLSHLPFYIVIVTNDEEKFQFEYGPVFSFSSLCLVHLQLVPKIVKILSCAPIWIFDLSGICFLCDVK